MAPKLYMSLSQALRMGMGDDNVTMSSTRAACGMPAGRPLDGT